MCSKNSGVIRRRIIPDVIEDKIDFHTPATRAFLQDSNENRAEYADGMSASDEPLS